MNDRQGTGTHKVEEGWASRTKRSLIAAAEFFKKRPLVLLAILVAVGLPVGGVLLTWKHATPEPARPYYIANQFIVIGPTQNAVTDVLEKALSELREEKPDLAWWPIQEYTLKRLDGSSLAMSLYHVAGELSMMEVIDGINEWVRNRAPGSGVSTDYNLLTGSPQTVCGSPDLTGGGSSFSTPKPLEDQGDASTLFWSQWAFGRIGLVQLLGAAYKGENLYQEKETLVGVFDTSPFKDPWSDATSSSLSGPDPIKTPEVVEWVNPITDVKPLTLQLTYPAWVTITQEMDGLQTDVRDHGLFVTGLIHAVAPASEVRLIRVLDQNGCGGIFTLNKALEYFINEVMDEREGTPKKGTLEGVVINLSLGIPGFSEGIEPFTTTLEGCIEQAGQGDNCTGQEACVRQVLCQLLQKAHQKGAVIVAAAGNESTTVNNPRPAQFPAAFAEVIGVGAVNDDGNPACFSNQGDVYAPGGYGGPNYNPGSDFTFGDLLDTLNTCEGDCPEGVISLVLFPPKGEAYWPTHYAYWSGTSFAAPLVSGLAALTLEAGAVPPGFVGGEEVCSVPNVIKGNVSQTGGVIVINVPEALYRIDINNCSP
jgi:hypothetical protein